MLKKHTYSKAFTVIELTVVIVVIAILAGVVIISYGNWRTELAAKEVQSDLSAAATAMENVRSFGSGYPADIPATFVAASTNTLVTYSEGDLKRFCLDGRSAISGNIYYFVDSANGSNVTKGTCAGGAGATPDTTIFVFDTTLAGCTGLTVQLPISSPSSSAGSVIDWGDGSTQALSSSLQSHTYATSGEKTVTYKGPITTISTNSIAAASRPCLKEVRQWANTISPVTINFRNSTNVQRVAAPPSTVSNMSYMFAGVPGFNQNISGWNTANVTNMSWMFYGVTAFNQPIGPWNTGKVTNMYQMFSGATSFNQNISSWNTANVTDMGSLFSGATAFNQPIGSWDTGKVTNMSSMLSGVSAFNQPIGSWNTSNVTSMSQMFMNSSTFNQPIGSWDTGKVTTMSGMFDSAVAFNQSLSGWNTGLVTNMNNMFFQARAFNGSVGSWNTANVTNMGSMFSGAWAFNQAIGSWNTSKVTDMGGMFSSAYVFNQNISSWNTGLVTNMNSMFSSAYAFNQPIATWNTSKVTGMGFMFYNATTFNQNLSGWNVTSVTTKPPSSFATGATAWTLAKPVWT